MVDNQDPITAKIGDPKLDTPQSDAAIDDIVAQEADQILAAEDANAAAQVDDLEVAEPRPHGHPIFWFIIALLATLSLMGAFLLLNPGSTYAP